MGSLLENTFFNLYKYEINDEQIKRSNINQRKIKEI